MPKAVDQSTSSRRHVLAALSGAALAGGGLAVAIPSSAPAVPAPPGNPDAELLTALAAFDDLERQISASYPRGCTYAEEKAYDDQVAPLRAEQRELLDRICATPAKTIAGVLARGRSLFSWDGGSYLAGPDDVDNYDDRRLIAALVRDVNALAGQVQA